MTPEAEDRIAYMERQWRADVLRELGARSAKARKAYSLGRLGALATRFADALEAARDAFRATYDGERPVDVGSSLERVRAVLARHAVVLQVDDAAPEDRDELREEVAAFVADLVGALDQRYEEGRRDEFASWERSLAARRGAP